MRCTVTGRTLGENLAGVVVHNADVIRPLDRPVRSTAHRSSSCAARSRPRARSSGRACAAGPDGAFRRGSAIVYDDVPEAIAGVQKGELKPGQRARAARLRTEGRTGDGRLGVARRVRDLRGGARERRRVRLRRPALGSVQQGADRRRGVARVRRRRAAGARRERRSHSHRRRRAHTRSRRAGGGARRPPRHGVARFRCQRQPGICRSTSAACSRCRRARCS